jgi:hypothetical protein
VVDESWLCDHMIDGILTTFSWSLIGI